MPFTKLNLHHASSVFLHFMSRGKW